MNRNDPINPIIIQDNNKPASVEDRGLTKREWFAGMALQALVISGRIFNDDIMTQRACSLADALLAELSKEP